uniref:Uncharacterized protein n=1 Tax=Sus scrofa TaxID=9823 RepID=A0A4X1TWD7_PIG
MCTCSCLSPCFKILWGIYLGVEWHGHMLILCLACPTVKWLNHFTFSLALYEGSKFSMSSPVLLVFCFVFKFYFILVILMGTFSSSGTTLISV